MSQSGRRTLFISYSRRDQVFVRRLVARLRETDFLVWVDWESIDYGTEFLRSIREGIESADVFIAVLSPSYYASRICNEELSHARELNKRILPVVRRSPHDDTGEFLDEVKAALYGEPWAAAAEANDAAMRPLNYLFFRKKEGYNCEYDEVTRQVINPECDGPESDADPFEPALAGLLEDLPKDTSHLRLHTRLTQRASEWQSSQRRSGYLLRGEALDEALTWRATPGGDPPPSRLHYEYIEASEKAARTERRNLGTLRVAAGVLLLGLIVIGAVLLFFELRRQEAIRLNPQARIPAGKLDAFSIDTYEVSYRQYALCPSFICSALPAVADDPDQPVANIDALAALDFCRWLGRRLPTLEEWTQAVFGGSPEAYPWPGGGPPEPEWVNTVFERELTRGASNRPAGTAAVNDPRYQNGVTANGLWHAVGNVREWTTTYAPGSCGNSACPTEWEGEDPLMGSLYVPGLSFVAMIFERGTPDDIVERFPAPGVNGYEDVGFRCAGP